MTIPKTTWHYSPQTEAVRILFTAHHIQNNFFSRQGFLVLPNCHPQINNSVVFPQAQYLTSPEFWRIASQTNQQFENYINHAQSPLTKDMIAYFSNQTWNFTILKKSWKSIQYKFWSTAIQILPELFTSITDLEIRPTNYGTKGSGFVTNQNPNKVTLYLRSDAPLIAILGGILIDRQSKFYNWPDRQWDENMAIKEFLQTKTKFKNLFPKTKSILTEPQQTQRGLLARQSQAYLTQLGFPPKTNFQIQNQTYFINNKQLKPTPT